MSEPGATGDRGPWMGTFTGKRFHFFDPRPEDVELADVAHHLSQINRYGGATRRTYSVAEHSVIVSLYVPPEYAREALLHDAAEAYVGDVIRPIKRKIGDGFAETERAVEAAVFARFGITPTPESRAAVKEVDDRIIRDEIDALMSDPGIYAEREWLRGMKPLGCAIAGLTARAAEHVFLQRFLEVFAGTPHTATAADLLGYGDLEYVVVGPALEET